MQATLDDAAVDELRDERLDWRFKAPPASAHGLTVAQYRDLPYDEGLPEPQLACGTSPLQGADVTALNDQHAFLHGAGDAVEVGDVARLGLTHPWTALGKWTLVPVPDDADAASPRVVDLIRTWF